VSELYDLLDILKDLFKEMKNGRVEVEEDADWMFANDEELVRQLRFGLLPKERRQKPFLLPVSGGKKTPL
jgi:hypothetical protein